MATVHPARTRARTLAVDAIAGLVVEVRDLAATRAFYDLVFGDAPGEWRETRRRLTYRRGAQHLEFVQRSQPRSLPHTGQHQAYHVPGDRLRSVADALAGAGHAVDWWREDRPAERDVTAYAHDPSGNRVQLVAAADVDTPISHAVVEVHDLELAETFYVKGLGGRVEYYHGWDMEDYAEAKAWEEGRDPCAPWTRRFDVRYWDKLRVARPNMQLFVAFGDGVLGLVLAAEHRQEPPEEVLKGTPRLILRARQPATAVAAYLSGRGIPFQAEGRGLFLRDPGGNYVELECED